MKPTQEQIDAAIEDVKDWQRLENYAAEGVLHQRAETILDALEAYKPVDVEGIKRGNLVWRENLIRQWEAKGWNDCLDHLVEKGIINDSNAGR